MTYTTESIFKEGTQSPEQPNGHYIGTLWTDYNASNQPVSYHACLPWRRGRNVQRTGKDFETREDAISYMNEDYNNREHSP